MIVESAFKPLWWLRNPHAQTVFPVVAGDNTPLPLLRERIELPDGDFFDLDRHDRAYAEDNVRVFCVLVHGLEGGPESVYAARMVRALDAAGFEPIRMYHRSCSGELNRHPQLYHSGFTDDVAHLVRRLKDTYPNRPVVLIGYSLGGSVCLNLIGRPDARDEGATPDAVVAVSVPLRLDLCADRIRRGFSRIYQKRLLRGMQEKLSRKRAQPEIAAELNALDLERALGATDFWDFDDAFTAPIHGFASVQAYYQFCSARQYLNNVEVPCLIIHAADDPFMTPGVIPTSEELSSSIRFELSAHGGHVGFVARDGVANPSYWLEPRVVAYLQENFDIAA